MTIQAISPATSEVLKTYEEMAPATVKDNRQQDARSLSRLAAHYL